MLDSESMRATLTLECLVGQLALARGITYEEAQRLEEAKPFIQDYEASKGKW